MNKKRSEWANEEGSALVLTLMIFLVLTVLATSISFLTVGSFRLSDINRDGTSAFYIAEAGAKSAYEKAKQDVMNKYKDAPTMDAFYKSLDALFLNTNRFDKQFSDDSTANVRFTATGRNPRKYTLTSTGSVGGKTRTVQKQFDVSWVEKGGLGGFPAVPENAALMTKGNIELKVSAGKPFIGDIYTNSPDADDRVNIHNSSVDYRRTKLFYPSAKTKEELLTNPKLVTPIEFIPVDTPIEWNKYENLFNNIKIPEKSGKTKKIADINVSPWKKYPLKIESEEIYISKLSITNYNNDIILEPTHDNTIIFVDDWYTAAENIKIEGDKKVTIVIKNKIGIDNTMLINANENKEGSPDKLTLIYLGATNFLSNNNTRAAINANIIVKNANVELKTTQINGVLYTGGESVNLSGGTSNSKLLLIAPKANVDMSGSYSIQGTVIANTFKMSGGAQLTTPDIPIGSGGPSTTPTLEDLLQSGPILEQ